MKIQKLHIFNIASIEDATIDFTAEPLASSDVFVIAGKTGAGKSTILDSISLALYNTTPRLHAAMNTRVENNSDNLTLNDPRQLMRRDTGEASITLDFEGIDGMNYRAYWHVQRGKNKKAGQALDTVDWSLCCMSDGNRAVTGKGTKTQEVEAAIKKAVGLEFDQFCRTTMLAQGEFTRFLKSSEKEKSEILAKITRLTDYAEIGKKIYEIEVEKEKAYNAAKQAAGDTGLTEQEILELTDGITELKTQLAQVKADKETADTKKAWLQIESQIAAKNLEISKHKEVLDGPDYKQKCQDIADWDASINARQQMGTESSEQMNSDAQDVLLGQYRKDCTIILGAREALRLAVEANNDRKAEIEAYLDSASGHKDEYTQASVLTEALERIAQDRAEMKGARDQAADLERKINGVLKTNLTEAEGNLANATSISGLLTKAEDVLKAQRAVARFHKAEEAYREKGEQLEVLKSIIEALNGKLEEYKGKIATQEGIVETCRKAYDKQKDTVEDWAKAMRSKLSSGEIDECPVCGQKVLNRVFKEDMLSALYDSAREEFESADKALQTLRNESGVVLSEKTGKQSSYETQKADYDKDASVKDAKADADLACTAVGLSMTEPQLDEALSTRLGEHCSKLADLGCTIERKDDVTDALDSVAFLKKKYSEKKLESLRKQVEDARNARNDAITKKSGLEGTQTALKSGLDSDIDKVKKVIAQELWDADPKGYAENTLGPAAKKYDAAVKELDDLSKDTSADKLSGLKSTISQIHGIFPEWKDDKPEETAMIENAQNEAVTLFANIKAANGEKERAAKAASEAGKAVDSFIAANPTFSRERLSVLEDLDNIDDIRQEVKAEEEKQVELQSGLNELESQRDKLTKPELAGGDTIEQLESVIKVADEQTIPSLNQQIGAKQKTLDDDEKKKSGLAALEAARDAAREDYDEWRLISSVLGDKEGQKFQMIAQSFILGDLLNSANKYLKEKKLAERYTLKAVPKTLHISIEDAYQGYATRSSDSLSGGESFLVSLALALALAEIGDGLGVDTLFIDEGFGSLSGAPLIRAINVLKGLHHTNNGRHIGVISHIDEVKANIPIQIQVEQGEESSSSTIKVVPKVG